LKILYGRQYGRMAGKNSQVHLFLETDLYLMLKNKAQEEGIGLNEIIRRKLYDDPTPEEIIVLRQLKGLLKNVRKK